MTDHAHGLRVMTFNLQLDWDNPPHTWSGRRDVAAELLRRERPHLIGTQEGLHGQLRDLESAIGADYAWIGQGREGGGRGEFMAVLYDRRRLEPLAHGHYWLSGTPEVIASNTWGGGWPRMVTWVHFRDLATGGELHAANTHFDHVSAYARERSGRLLAERLNALAPDLPRIVTGDFNAPARHDAVHTALLAEADLVDTWDAAEERSPAYGTFHGHRPPVAGGERIDWILASRGTRVRSAAVNTFAAGGRFPSDHLPVQALVHVPAHAGTHPDDRPHAGTPR
ncbi:endonuclease/exonuclease/phosphatase family protein [Streptomyces sp. NBC_01619]|uniref:endonuclease/exonuclease/phosphatase family protein n=1 Tax=unclassified Streptomyces TaxID=2593676 RepID=UPI00225A720F|nr:MULTISPECIES: endonuclease/exonuclease/phosphatase family protein [unclassified Streptomyces]MCX4510754.1 endonuclease/exonuclease/phosphatase family protein [Streptomyces sp. NBC_01619]